MSEQTLADDLAEIRKLLAEAYEHYFTSGGDHCKSSEGAIAIHYPPFFWREHGEVEPAVSIYSYVLGPSRMHDFDSSAEALAAVRKWHSEEMSYVSDDEWGR